VTLKDSSCSTSCGTVASDWHAHLINAGLEQVTETSWAGAVRGLLRVNRDRSELSYPPPDVRFVPRATEFGRSRNMSRRANSSHGTHPELEATVAEESATDVA
jgi:hypothetical protein